MAGDSHLTVRQPANPASTVSPPFAGLLKKYGASPQLLRRVAEVVDSPGAPVRPYPAKTGVVHWWSGLEWGLAAAVAVIVGVLFAVVLVAARQIRGGGPGEPPPGSAGGPELLGLLVIGVLVIIGTIVVLGGYLLIRRWLRTPRRGDVAAVPTGAAAGAWGDRRFMGSGSQLPAFDVLWQAVTSRSVVRLQYANKDELTLEPWVIAWWQDKPPVVVGWEQETQSSRVLWLDWIADEITTVGPPGSFAVPADARALVAELAAPRASGDRVRSMFANFANLESQIVVAMLLESADAGDVEAAQRLIDLLVQRRGQDPPAGWNPDR